MTDETKYLAIFVIIGSLFYLIEGIIPKPLPWLKLGFSNIATLVAIYFFQFDFILKLVVIRIIIGSLITATFLTPSFILSLSGGLASAILMFLLHKSFKKFISPIGISIAGSVTHLTTQLIVVYMILINDKAVLSIFPLILLTGLLSGSIVGYLSYKVIKRLEICEIFS